MSTHHTRFACLALLVGAALPAWADTIEAAASDLCEHVRACAMAQVKEEDMTPEMRQMMEPMLDNMCANMQSKVQEVPMNHELYQPAVACMRSMTEVSCADFQNGDKLQTPPCDEYQRLAEKYFPQGAPQAGE